MTFSQAAVFIRLEKNISQRQKRTLARIILYGRIAKGMVTNA